LTQAAADAVGTGPLLEVNNLSVTFSSEAGAVTAVRSLSYDVRPGEVLGIVGESGSGKSVSSLAMMGLLPANAEVTGAFLKKVREIRGLELNEISQRTKISERYLRALEDEEFTDMPAAVYVRGYVTEYARALRLDPQRAAESYLVRYRAKLPKPAPAPSASG